MPAMRTCGPLAAATLFLAACGGGGEDAPSSERGNVLAASLAAQVSTAQIDAGTAASGLQALSGPATCNVDVRYVLYTTRDPKGAQATASAGVLVPSGSGSQCSGERPVLLYAHGTTTSRAKNMADVRNDKEASLLMAMYAAQGYIVVAPNYLGYEKSSLAWHPYLNAKAQAVDMVDGLRAAKTHLKDAKSGSTASSQLFIAGYSQGGHVALATQREIQTEHAGEFSVTAAAGMSGPYNLSGFARVVNAPASEGGRVNAGALLFTPMLLTSYQNSYGNVYAKASDAYREPYAKTIEALLPSDEALESLLDDTRLPKDPTLTRLFGEGGLLTDSFRQDFLTNENNGFRKALVANDLTSFKPSRPVALCGGSQDPTVFYSINTGAMQAQINEGRPVQAQVPAFDLENRATLPPGTAVDLMAQKFADNKAALAAAGGPTEVAKQYHGSLVPPFCNALVRAFFQQVAQQPGL